MDSSCLTASTDQTKPGPSDRGEKGSGEGWWNWPPSIIFFKGTKADVGYPPKFINLNLETTWHYQMIPKLWDLHVGWLQSLQICTSIRPCHDILHGLRVRLFVSSPMLWRIKGMGGVGRWLAVQVAWERERERLCGPSAARFGSAKLDAYDAVETRISFYKLRYNIYTHAYIYIHIIWLMIYQVASLVLNAGFILVIFARSKFMELLISQISGEC